MYSLNKHSILILLLHFYLNICINPTSTRCVSVFVSWIRTLSCFSVSYIADQHCLVDGHEFVVSGYVGNHMKDWILHVTLSDLCSGSVQRCVGCTATLLVHSHTRINDGAFFSVYLCCVWCPVQTSLVKIAVFMQVYKIPKLQFTILIHVSLN